MLHYIDHKKMGRGSHGWLDSHFHFSFAEYYNPDNIRFGILRVLNDDIVQPGQGFDVHPHRDMEIISYVVQGELSHKDSMGNAHTLTRGQFQYMSAGTGVMHSEYNCGAGELRFMQMWIFPDKKGYKPNYGDYRFAWEDRVGRWLPVASAYENAASTAPIRIHADADVYVAALSSGESISFSATPDRQAYLVLKEGGAKVGSGEAVNKAGGAKVDGGEADNKVGGEAGSIILTERDALEIVKQDVTITADGSAHLYLIDMPYDDTCYKEKYGDSEILRNGA